MRRLTRDQRAHRRDLRRTLAVWRRYRRTVFYVWAGLVTEERYDDAEAVREYVDQADIAIVALTWDLDDLKGARQ